MKIKNILSIGSGCDSMFFTSALNLRYKGPIDNVLSINGFLSTKYLFDKTLYNDIINKNYNINSGINKGYEYDFLCGTWNFIHNDISKEHYYNILINRFNNFYKYLNNAEKDKQLFFIYCVYFNDPYFYDKNIINECFNNLPDHVKNRLLIIDCGWFSEFNINNYPIYRGISHDKLLKASQSNTLINNNDIINDFNNWWSQNKYFYERLNNCEYDLI